MKVNNATFKTFLSKGQGLELKFEIDDKQAKTLGLDELINLKKKVGTLRFEIDAGATLEQANKITQPQQAKLHVLYKEYADFTGSEPDEAKKYLVTEWVKSAFPTEEAFAESNLDMENFETKDLTIQDGSKLIEFVTNFLLKEDIPMNNPDIKDKAMLEASFRNKLCLICGNKQVQPGKINGVQFFVCEKHRQEIKTKGAEKFAEAYHLREYFYG